jgi:hypothetical protein
MRSRPHVVAMLAAGALAGFGQSSWLEAANTQPQPPPRKKPTKRSQLGARMIHVDGTLNVGRNAEKRRHRQAYASAKGAPGGWKLVVRRLKISARSVGARWPT